MNRGCFWMIAESLGTGPLGLLGIDDTWSGSRLRPAR
jgi:hypothetical protein